MNPKDMTNEELVRTANCHGGTGVTGGEAAYELLRRLDEGDALRKENEEPFEADTVRVINNGTWIK